MCRFDRNFIVTRCEKNIFESMRDLHGCIEAYNASSAYQCWRCGPPVSDVTVRQYTEGTFIVDLIDPLRNRSVWRSTIQSRINATPDPETAGERRQRAAQAVLAPFPPEPVAPAESPAAE